MEHTFDFDDFSASNEDIMEVFAGALIRKGPFWTAPTVVLRSHKFWCVVGEKSRQIGSAKDELVASALMGR